MVGWPEGVPSSFAVIPLMVMLSTEATGRFLHCSRAPQVLSPRRSQKESQLIHHDLVWLCMVAHRGAFVCVAAHYGLLVFCIKAHHGAGM